MKGIVVEIKKGKAAALSDDGAVYQIKNSSLTLGQVVDVKHRRRHHSRLITGAASFVAAAAICTTGAFAYYTPTDYVSLDVNPSIEYSINMFDRILDVKAVNDNGEEILSSLYLDNMTIEDAVKATIDVLVKDGYMASNANEEILITTSNAKPDKASKLAKELKKEIQDYINEQPDMAATVKVEAVGKARVEEAKQLGITPGKLNLIQKLQATTEDPKDIKVEEWAAKPVKEINKAIKENKKNANNSMKEQGKNKGQGINKIKKENQNVDGVKLQDKQYNDQHDKQQDKQYNNQHDKQQDKQHNNQHDKQHNDQHDKQHDNQGKKEKQQDNQTKNNGNQEGRGKTKK